MDQFSFPFVTFTSKPIFTMSSYGKVKLFLYAWRQIILRVKTFQIISVGMSALSFIKYYYLMAVSLVQVLAQSIRDNFCIFCMYIRMFTEVVLSPTKIINVYGPMPKVTLNDRKEVKKKKRISINKTLIRLLIWRRTVVLADKTHPKYMSLLDGIFMTAFDCDVSLVADQLMHNMNIS